MSIERKEHFTCSACGQVNEFILWQSLNGDLDPDAKQRLLDGDLFRFRCDKCGHETQIIYPLLYHDMTHRAMVYFVEEDAVEQTRSVLDNIEKATEMDMPGYRKRIVTDANALREKAIIFEHGLDDRVVEIIKLLYLVDAWKQFPNAGIEDVYFIVDEEKYILEFLGDELLHTEIAPEAYVEIQNAFAPRLEAAENDACTIDRNWAMRFLKG